MFKKICKGCGEKFIVIKGRREKFCSLSCYRKNQKGFWLGKKRPKMTGKNNNFWKGGIRKSSGYVWILQPNHLKAVNKYVKRAILVMEKKIKRLLTKEEVVHHINEIKNDDRPENLYLFSDGNKHKSYHLRNYANKKRNQTNRANL